MSQRANALIFGSRRRAVAGEASDQGLKGPRRCPRSAIQPPNQPNRVNVPVYERLRSGLCIQQRGRPPAAPATVVAQSSRCIEPGQDFALIKPLPPQDEPDNVRKPLGGPTALAHHEPRRRVDDFVVVPICTGKKKRRDRAKFPASDRLVSLIDFAPDTMCVVQRIHCDFSSGRYLRAGQKTCWLSRLLRLVVGVSTELDRTCHCRSRHER